MLFEDENISTQTILLTLQGKLVSSCNSIFDSQKLAPYPALQELPILQSVLQTFQKDSTKIHFPRIETVYPSLPGFYDFTFEIVTIKDQSFIRWLIYDLTHIYKTLQKNQQKSHENDIKNTKNQ